MTDIYDRLETDHDKQRELIKKIMATGEHDPENIRAELYAEFREEALAHANAEEQTFYAEMIAKPHGQEKARHSIVEHEEMDKLFQELDDMDPSDAGWMPKFGKLGHELNHHVDEEENEIFERARKVIDDNRAHTLVLEFEKRKDGEEKIV